MKTPKLIQLIASICCIVYASSILFSPALAEENTLPLEDLQIFVDVFSKIKDSYVDPVGDSDLLNNAIHGMLDGLDPHSSFLESKHYKEIRHNTEGKFGGLGLEISNENGLLKVITPIDSTPAYEAGIQAGDLIVRIDGLVVKEMNLLEATKKMRGAPGTQVILTIVRPGKGKPFDITLTRAIIKIASVKASLIEDGYGYVRIANFQTGTGESLRSKIAQLRKQSSNDIKGLILDLRNNPGGVLAGAIEVCDVFLSQGDIVSIRGRNPKANAIYSATASDSLNNAPLVVLVNSGSASASEIVAGALQDNKRAIIMGTRTFGKGSVQTVIPLNNGTALKITTARYYTPNNRTIQATGIEPDIIIKQTKYKPKQPEYNLRESDLANHLRNENDKKRKQSDTNDKKTKIKLIESDLQISTALNLLKAMNLERIRVAK